MFSENLRIALKALWANKLRSVLTTLGIMIGVTSVIAVVSIVQGLQFGISKELQGVGSTFIEVFPDAGEQRTFAPRIPDLTYEDGVAVRRSAPEVREFTPIFFTMAETKYRDVHHTVTLLAVGDTYQEVVNHWVERGRFFSPLDSEAKKRVCTLGKEAAKKLGLSADPTGRTVSVNGTSFTVIGIMETKGNSFGRDRDDIVIIPFSTAGLIYGPEETRKLVLDFQARSASQIDLAREQITEVLRNRHRLKKKDADDFRILLQEELLKTISKVLLSTSLIMGAVVGIALLVGGIGIMNIMLVSVTERTREIGIRKSIGARRRDVLMQFLIEAIVLSGLGGVIGIVGGMALANGIRLYVKRWIEFPPVHTPIWAVVLAFTFCAFLGTIFGVYPAAKASKLDPIDALRYE
jgi:putative ABC transport system permease protein